MIFELNSNLVPSALYETSFHLPIDQSREDLEAFLKKHAKLMPGLLNTGPIIKMKQSREHTDHNHFMVLYPFESLAAAKSYVENPEISAPVREAFTKAYGEVAKDRTRYLNGKKV